LLREIIPGLRHLAIKANVGAPGAVQEMGEVREMAQMLGIKIALIEIRRAEDISPAIEALKSRAEALYLAIEYHHSEAFSSGLGSFECIGLCAA
jgi:ABC-type uncharacterized transport system substrate-binding protein